MDGAGEYELSTKSGWLPTKLCDTCLKILKEHCPQFEIRRCLS